MKTRRFVTAETKLGGVRTKVEDVVGAGVNGNGPTVGSINLWGFDSVPPLPVRPEEIASDYAQKGLFAPLGGMRVNLITIEPTEEPPGIEVNDDSELGTGGNLVEHASGGGMHRSDSVDLIFVLSGSINVTHPRDDGGEDEITLNAGDFLVQNGAFHRWHNCLEESCTFLAFIFPAERKR